MTTQTGSQQYNSSEHKSKRTHDSPVCSRCKTQIVDVTKSCACYNFHYMCNICLQFLIKTHKQLMCPKCKYDLEVDHGMKKTQPTNRHISRIENSGLPSTLTKNSELRKSKSDEIRNPSDNPAEIKSGKKDVKQNANSMKSKLNSREESSDEDDIVSCHGDSPNPLMFSYNTFRYVVPARPVVCPLTMCRRNVAATGFISHFEFEHQEVSIIEVVSGEQYTLIVNPEQVSDDIIGCICLFTLTTVGKPTFCASRTDNLSDVNKDLSKTILVPFTMMIARVTFRPPEARGGDNQKQSARYSISSDIDILVIWISGFDSSPVVYYSLEATYNNYRTRACIYSGPVISLRENQDPVDLFRRGECLILSPGLTSSLCEDTGSLDINVSFH